MAATETSITTLTPSTSESALTGKAFLVHDPSTGDGSAVATSVITGLIGAKYTKPGTGIPSTDLASAVQTSLGKADAALPAANVKQEVGTSQTDVLSQKATTDLLATKLDTKDAEYNYAKKGASSPQAVVGFSGGVIDTYADGAREELLYRISEKDRVSQITKFEGKTLAYNQYVKIQNSSATVTVNGVTFTDNRNGSYTCTGTSSAAASLQIVYNTWYSGHKYYIAAYSSPIKIMVSGYSNWLSTVPETATAIIDTCTNTYSSYAYIGTNSTGVNTGGVIATPVIFDLTLMFGAGNEPSTVEGFEAMFHPGYHPYNAGSLISNDASALETTGFNQWDEEWREGTYSSSDGETFTANTGYLCAKNKIKVLGGVNYYINLPGGKATRYFLYDQNGFMVSTDTMTSGVLAIPSSVGYLRFQLSYSTTSTVYNHDICINLSDASRNGQYAPYKKSVLNLGLNNIRVKSHNIWDEEWENGYWDIENGGAAHDGANVRCKNFIPCFPNTDYCLYKPDSYPCRLLYFDANKTMLSTEPGASATKTIFTTPAGCMFIKFYCSGSYGTTYNNDICINVSSSFNGQYEPHGILTINGVKSAGSVYDEIVGNKYVKRVGEVDMGTLEYTKYSVTEGTLFRAGISDSKSISSATTIANILCAKYNITSNTSRYEKSISEFNTNIDIIDSSYSDAAAFKTAMNGVYLYYELATPETYELVDSINCAFEEQKGGYIRVLGDEPQLPLVGYFHYGKTTKEMNLAIADMQGKAIAEGIADTISAGTAQEFVYRQSGGDGVNYMKRIKGKTLAWNQIININAWRGSSGAGTTITVVDGKVRINGTATQTYDYVTPSSVKDAFVAGHKYILRHRGSDDIKGAVNANNTYPSFVTNADVLLTVNTVNASSLYVEVTNGITYNNAEAYFNIFDLTLMFGAGNEPSTVEEFEAMFPNSYYSYNAGSLISNDASALETVGFNQWDEEWEQGSISIDDGQNEGATTRIRSKNYISVLPATAYYIRQPSTGNNTIFYYDAGYNFLTYDSVSGSGTFTTPANCGYIRFRTATVYGGVYNHDICINLSDSNFNGTYEPYWKRTIGVSLNSFQVRNPQTGEVITVNGLKSAGSVYDEIVGNKYVKRVGSVDLGTLAWQDSGTASTYRTSTGAASGIITASSWSMNGTCQKYTPRASSFTSEDKVFAFYNGQIWIKDTSYTASTFGAAMSGVYMTYQLATPVEYELVEPMGCAVLVDELGTEKVISPVHEDGTPSAPFCCDSNYSISVKNLLAKLNSIE